MEIGPIQLRSLKSAKWNAAPLKFISSHTATLKKKKQIYNRQGQYNGYKIGEACLIWSVSKLGSENSRSTKETISNEVNDVN